MNKPKNCCYICDAPIFGNVSKKRRVLCPHCTDKLVAKVRALEAITKKPIKNKADFDNALIKWEESRKHPQNAISSRSIAPRMASGGQTVQPSPIGLVKQPILSNEAQVNAITKRRTIGERRQSKGDGQGDVKSVSCVGARCTSSPTRVGVVSSYRASPALTLDGREV